ncbi:DUF1810 family protein [Halopseudomonas litoralis]|uniref:DUF1810 family protein n=1 Tax=Halopseudomonas litoralis TaxID=797277 RepID=UPI000B7DD08D|nr:DUF1810 family protein [Halopseudomonas litoralis]
MACRKKTHWIWFVFPRFKGLGSSFNAERYGLSGLAEAKAYLEHPLLGSRLREACNDPGKGGGSENHQAGAGYVLGRLCGIFPGPGFPSEFRNRDRGMRC